MKKKIYFLALAISLSVVSPAVMAAETKEAPLTEQQQARIQNIEQRVLEIKSMDKSNLSRQERKDLRKELLGMKKEMKAATSGGVYLSVGAIIIIILILILIL